jgi:EAL domain-containing protein (putative c-di-GMP-specific phosphodiesterase class I)
MAHKLNIKVIAEGVETKLQHDLLLKAGCDYAQGYYLSKPMHIEQFHQYLTTSKRHIG